jgi:uncharacterized membrane protein
VIFFSAAGLAVFAVSPAWIGTVGHGLLGVAIFAFFSRVCHQHADRSFMLLGAQTAVCVRCLGIYAGAAIGSLSRLRHGVAMRVLGAALALNCADVAAESLGLHGNLPLMRLLMGGALGIAVGAILSARPLSATDPGAHSVVRPEIDVKC